MRFMVGLAQMNPVLADVAANLEKHLDFIAKAIAAKADLLVFPELSLTGYSVQDLAPDVTIRVFDSAILKSLSEASATIDIVVSFVEEDERYQRYISAAYLSEGAIVHLHRKVYLPTYRMFDEARYFTPGSEARAFDTRWGKMGLLVCEDYWHLSLPYVLWQDGADILLCLAAQPASGVTAQDGLFESNRTKASALTTYGRFLTDFVIHCNRVGFEEGVGFSGDSFVAGPDGRILARTGQFDEELLVVEIDTDVVRRQRIVSPMLRDERLDLTLRELSQIAASRGGQR